MKEVIPYSSGSKAIEALDNGGRFYNIFTKAGDDSITSVELATVAGVFSNKQMMSLYFDMAVHDLEPEEQGAIRELLSDDLRMELSKHAPSRWLPSEAKSQAQPSSSAIITGYPRFVENKTEFSGFIMIPMTTGNTTTIMMLPIMDYYDVYELRDEGSDQSFFIANVRGEKRLPETLFRFGGVVKQTKKKAAEEPKIYLEAAYFTAL